MRLLLFATLALAAAPASTAPLVYSARADFRAASGPIITERFSKCDPVTTAFTGPLSAATDIGACAAGDILPGITFVDDPGPDGLAMYLAAPFHASNRTTALGQNNPASDALNLTLAAPTRAVGFNLYQNFGGGAQLGEIEIFTVSVFGAGDALIGSYDVGVPADRAAFFGIVDPDGAILKVAINNPVAFDLIDNVSFSGAAPTPAPPMLALFGLGAAALGLRRRR